jgi:hypothetical protein
MVAIQYSYIGLMNIIAVTVQQPTQVTSCCNLLLLVRRLSFSSRSARTSFSQVQRVFIVEHCLSSRSYLNCQNSFRDTFSDPSVPNKPAECRLANRFWSLQKSFIGLHKIRNVVNACIAEPVGVSQTLVKMLFLCLLSSTFLFFFYKKMCQEWVL